MIKPEQIPDDVALRLLDLYALWHGDTDQAREAIAAALNAWPGANFQRAREIGVLLPLPVQKDDK